MKLLSTLILLVTSVTCSAQLAWVSKGNPNTANGQLIMASPTGVVYVAGGSGFSGTFDNGATWVLLQAGKTVACCLNANNEPVIGVGGVNGGTNGIIYRMQNGVFSAAVLDTPATGQWRAMCRGVGNTLLAATYGNIVYRSADGGSSWVRVATAVGGQSAAPWAIAKAPDDSIWIGGEYSGGVYKSTDNGTTWAFAGLDTASGWKHNHLSFAFTSTGETIATRGDPTLGNRHTEILRNGSWTPVGIGTYQITWSVVTHPATGQIFYGTEFRSDQSSCLYSSADNGTSWKRDNAGLDSTQAVRGLTVNPKDGSLWAVLQNGAVFSAPAGPGTVPQPVTLRSISVTPSSASIQTGASIQFNATGTGSDGLPFALGSLTWQAATGAISNNGLFTAPSVAGSVTITATQTGVSGFGTVTVVASAPPILKILSIDPDFVAYAGVMHQFTITAKDQYGANYDYRSFGWSVLNGNGVISPNGLACFGTVTGGTVVRATVDGMTADCLVNLTVPPGTGVPQAQYDLVVGQRDAYKKTIDGIMALLGIIVP